MVTIFYNGFNGRVESDGRIFDNPYGGSAIGHIDSNGRIWDSATGGSNAGRIDSEGKIWGGTSGNVVGYIDSNGNIFDSDRNVIGRIRWVKGPGDLPPPPDDSGCGCAGIAGIIGAFLIFAILRSWGGRVGAILGFGIGFITVTVSSTHLSNESPVGIGIFYAFLFGLIGAIIDKIVRLITKSGVKRPKTSKNGNYIHSTTNSPQSPEYPRIQSNTAVYPPQGQVYNSLKNRPARKKGIWIFLIVLIVLAAIVVVVPLAVGYISELNNGSKQNQKITEQSESDDEDYYVVGAESELSTAIRRILVL